MLYILIILVTLLLLTVIDGRTIYKVYQTGQCLPPASPITDPSKCEQQSIAINWPDTSPTSVSFSSYLPKGCILKTETNDLRVYAKDSSIQCSLDYKCLCEITADDCVEGLNREACLCSENVCSRATGLVCSSGQCVHAPECSEGLNSDVCRCGSTDCTPSSGLKCSSGVCEHAEICPNRIGGDPNPESCQCGDIDCYSDRMYCYSESSTCISACPGGTYVNHLLQCLPCNIRGYYCPEGATGSPTSFECPAGRYGQTLSLPSPDDCIECPAGRYSTIAAITSPEHCTGRCPAGTYSEETGLSAADQCKGRCSAGKYSYETGLNSDYQCKGRCSAGKWSSLTGITSDCQSLCPRGKYGSITGATDEGGACKECPIGHQCGSTQMTVPQECPVGSYQAIEGQTECVFCPINTYSGLTGASNCSVCPKNLDGIPLKTSGLGANSVSQCQLIKKTCPSGQRLISDTCVNCPIGFFSGATSRCLLCPMGFYQPKEAQFECLSGSSEMIGSIKEDTPVRLFGQLKTTKIHKDITEDPFPVGIVIVYSSLVAGIVIVIAIHRCCPVCFKEADLIFSGDHIIEDTHARRILKTRLGASFTVSMPFVVALVAVFVFTSDNELIQNGLVPIAIENLPSDAGLFQKIKIDVWSESARGLVACDKINIETELNCSKTLNITNVCLMEMECWCHPPFGGIHEIEIILPDEFQRIILTLEPTSWNNTQTQITVPIFGETPLTGDYLNPTLIDFDVIRSKSQSHIDSSKEYGIQMSYRDSKEVRTFVGTEQGEHTIKVRLFSTETMFILEIIQKLSDLTRIGTVLSLTISAISGLRLIKLSSEHCIDKTCQTCCKDPPKDVRKRISILEERSHELKKKKNITKVKEGKIIEDVVTGRKYSYNPVTRKSVWVEDITL